MILHAKGTSRFSSECFYISDSKSIIEEDVLRSLNDEYDNIINQKSNFAEKKKYLIKYNIKYDSKNKKFVLSELLSLLSSIPSKIYVKIDHIYTDNNKLCYEVIFNEERDWIEYFKGNKSLDLQISEC